MAKDPAFLFYPNDYIGGTMGMTFEEKGAYMELLMMQFNRGHMTSHMIGQTVGQIWVNIKDKFIQDEKGLWYNKRLEDEKTKRQKYSESRRNNKSGANQYTKNEKKYKKGSGHMTSHMENENEIENINRVEIEKRKEEFKNFIIQTVNNKRQNYSIYKSDLKDFFEYWTEHGPKDRKMRFEKEKSFGMSRRLDTWFKNKEKFNNEKQTRTKQKGATIEELAEITAKNFAKDYPNKE